MFWILLTFTLTSHAFFEATLYKEALEQHQKGDPLSKKELGWALYYEKRFDEAISALLPAKTQDEHLIVGLCYKETGKLEQAIESFKQANEPLEVAIALKENQNYEEAKKIFYTLDEKTSNLWIAKIALEENDLILAEELIKKEKKTQEGKYLAGFLAYKQKDFKKAKEIFNQNTSDERCVLGLGLLLKDENKEAALKYFYRSFKISPNFEALLQILEIDGKNSIYLLDSLPGQEAKLAKKIQGPKKKEVLIALGKRCHGALKEKIQRQLQEEEDLHRVIAHLAAQDYEKAWELIKHLPNHENLKQNTLSKLVIQNPKYIDLAEHHFSPQNLALLMLKCGNIEKAQTILQTLEGDTATYLSCLAGLKPFSTFVQTYPKSQFAAECDFRYYSWQDYLTNPKAKEALSKFPLKYPSSPFSIAAHYLLALDSKNFLVAIDHLKKARDLYRELSEPEIFQEIFIQSSLQEVELNIKIAKNSEGVKKKVYLDEAKTILTPLLGNIHADYLSAIVFLELGEKKLALDQFEKVIAKNTNTLFHARSLFQLALLENSPKAIDLIEKAMIVGSCHVGDDERLSWGIEKAKLLIKQQKLDLAMLTLSQVINDPSPSHQRIEAMLLRADVYEKQGREELSKKQLQAVANKGGTFAKIAKQKLDVIYGL